MPGSDVCELHEVYRCTICSGKDQQVSGPDDVVGDSKPFPSKFNGRCEACDLPIAAGALIARRSYWGGRTAYIHDGC
jgi:hypothetical protein